MKLERRVVRLEAAGTRERNEQECAGCGAGTADKPTFHVVFCEAEGRERCGECGRRMVFRIEFDRSG